MIKLNDDNLIVGQIKQTLHTFNLPQCQVGSTYPKPHTTFITRDHIMRWDSNKQAIPCDKYLYGHEYLNITANLPIRNMIYDRETHRYLGKYLRFIRDYNGVDLMSMYNCCDGDINTQPLTFDINEDTVNKKSISFKSGSDNCTVYKVPISINTFTICSHSFDTMEVCLYVNNSNEDHIDTVKSIAKLTYKKRKVNKYFTYSPFDIIDLMDTRDEDLNEDDPRKKYRAFILDNISELFLLIKISDKLDTSLVVLEGSYVDNNTRYQKYFVYRPTILVDSDEANISLLAIIQESKAQARQDIAFNMEDSRFATLHAKTGELLVVKPSSTAIDGALVDAGYNIAAQLLSLENTTGNYLIADRLIEYLTSNAISPLSESYEIKRAQNTLNAIRKTSIIDPDNKYPQNIIECKKLYGDVIRKRNSISKKNISTESIRYSGIWHPADTFDVRAIACKSGVTSNYDTVGYIDKDIEILLKGVLDHVKI